MPEEINTIGRGIANEITLEIVEWAEKDYLDYYGTTKEDRYYSRWQNLKAGYELQEKRKKETHR